jgi:hypothetical protein
MGNEVIASDFFSPLPLARVEDEQPSVRNQARARCQSEKSRATVLSLASETICGFLLLEAKIGQGFVYTQCLPGAGTYWVLGVAILMLSSLLQLASRLAVPPVERQNHAACGFGGDEYVFAAFSCGVVREAAVFGVLVSWEQNTDGSWTMDGARLPPADC